MLIIIYMGLRAYRRFNFVFSYQNLYTYILQFQNYIFRVFALENSSVSQAILCSIDRVQAYRPSQKISLEDSGILRLSIEPGRIYSAYLGFHNRNRFIWR